MAVWILSQDPATAESPKRKAIERMINKLQNAGVEVAPDWVEQKVEEVVQTHGEAQLDEQVELLIGEFTKGQTMKEGGLSSQDKETITTYQNVVNMFVAQLDTVEALQILVKDKEQLSEKKQRGIEYISNRFKEHAEELSGIVSKIENANKELKQVQGQLSTAIEKGEIISLPENVQQSMSEAADGVMALAAPMEEMKGLIERISIAAEEQHWFPIDHAALLKTVQEHSKAADSAMSNIQKIKDFAKSGEIEELPMDTRRKMAHFMESSKNVDGIVRSRHSLAEVAIGLAEDDLKQHQPLQEATVSAINEFLAITKTLIDMGLRASELLEESRVAAAEMPTVRMTDIIPGLNVKDWVDIQLKNLDELAKMVREGPSNGGIIIKDQPKKEELVS